MNKLDRTSEATPLDREAREGQFAQPAANRANLSGLIRSAIPIFWNTEK
jgi:hypothetical protein